MAKTAKMILAIPFVVPNAREMVLDDICRGYVEDVILFRYAVFQSVVDDVRGML